jgi:hypothetical protein
MTAAGAAETITIKASSAAMPSVMEPASVEAATVESTTAATRGSEGKFRMAQHSKKQRGNCDAPHGLSYFG